MAFRSYMLAGLEAGTEREGLIQTIKVLEAMDEVNFVEAVLGPYDLLISVESEDPVEQVVTRLREVARVRELVALKVMPVTFRERMWKNIQKLPDRASV